MKRTIAAFVLFALLFIALTVSFAVPAAPVTPSFLTLINPPTATKTPPPLTLIYQPPTKTPPPLTLVSTPRDG